MELCQYHLQDQFGPAMASHLSSPLYYKQIEYTDKKGEQRKKKVNQQPLFFMQNLSIQKNLIRFRHHLQQKENKKLVHLTILINSVRLKWL